MKKILLTTICLAFATFSFSQQLSQYVVASGGNYSTAIGISVSYQKTDFESFNAIKK